MRRHLRALPFLALPLLVPACAAAPNPPAPPGVMPDLADLPRLRNFAALRVSSNNRDPELQRRQPAAHCRRDGRRWPTHRPRHHQPHLAHRRRQRVRLAAPAAPAHLLRRQPASRASTRRSATSSASATASSARSTRVDGAQLLQRAVAQQLLADAVWQALRITVTNEGRRRVSNLYYHVDWRKLPRCRQTPRTSTRATGRRCRPLRRKPYEILSVQGQGHYVGTVLNIVQNEPAGSARATSTSTSTATRTPSSRARAPRTTSTTRGASASATRSTPACPSPTAPASAHGWARIAGTLSIPCRSATALRFDIEHAGWTYNADGTVRSALRGARGPVQQRRVLVPARHRHRSARPAVRRRAPAASATRSRSRSSSAPRRSRPRAARRRCRRTCSGRRTSCFFEGSGSRRGRHDPLRRPPPTAATSWSRSLRTAPTTAPTSCELDGQSTASSTVLEHEPGANAGTRDVPIDALLHRDLSSRRTT